jgi:hypothetical protein
MHLHAGDDHQEIIKKASGAAFLGVLMLHFLHLFCTSSFAGLLGGITSCTSAPCTQVVSEAD